MIAPVTNSPEDPEILQRPNFAVPTRLIFERSVVGLLRMIGETLSYYRIAEEIGASETPLAYRSRGGLRL